MLAQLKIRTEYSFRTCYGPIEQVVNRLQSSGIIAAAITDRNGTFGHIAWSRLCKAAGIKPIFGVELAFTPDVAVKERRQELYYLPLLARSDAGLREIYAAVEMATSHFYHVPRLPIKMLDSFTQDVLVLSGNAGVGPHKLPETVIVEAHPATNPALIRRGNYVPVSDNYMVTPDDRDAYEICIGRGAFNRPSPMHILTASELKNECSFLTNFSYAYRLANECNAELLPATNIKSDEIRSLLELCMIGAGNRKIELNDVYVTRLHHELDLIEQKGFVDYFKVVADMMRYAKQHMMVGPARGSSCGSLVCYLLHITDIDPIPHGLIFERFIDITRSDLPDVDMDFPDTKRHMVLEYLTTKYGNDKVAKLGTISRYKARSAIGETAKAVKIPAWEAEQIADSIITRMDGDDRADLCIYDSLHESELLKQYPNIMVASKLEAHARHAGTHAAGLVITNEPITNFVAKDIHNNRVMIDKYDCESINLMKVDALGLRTLSIIGDCLEQIGWTKEALLAHPLDDDGAYGILRSRLFCGVFQFEGNALQNLSRKVIVDRFTDISALTALARPGPLISGAAYDWCSRRMGKKETTYLHPLLELVTNETYGLVVYQEQMLRIVREIGGMSWEDATLFRRGINKKLGMEYFDATFWLNFKSGAESNGIEETLARQIWETINSAGGYAFNKSHSVAYAMVTYWCCILKSRYPLEFALAFLKHTSDTTSVKQMLREIDRMGYKFKTYDVEQSEYNWSVKNGELIGGLINIIGVGDKTARSILAGGNKKRLQNAKTNFDNVFEARVRFSDLLANPAKYGIISKLWELTDIGETEGTYTFLAKVVKWKIRSLNEAKFLAERGGMKVPNDRWLTLTLEDDSDTIPATISRFNYPRFGLPLTKYKLGEWYLFRGQVKEGNRRVYVEKFKQIG